MGGRGASSGISVDGKKYGTEFRSVYESGNIKFIKYNDSSATKAPLETMTKGRVYATTSERDEVKYITYYDKNNLRFKQIDVSGMLTRSMGHQPYHTRTWGISTMKKAHAH